MKENIFVYFTSDLHSHFENWPKIMQYLSQKKEDRLRNNEAYFLFDNGDHLDRVHPITEASLGKDNVALLNQANYDAITLGNNEGITLDYQDLFHLYDEAEFTVVCANLSSKNGVDPPWLKKSTILKTPSGIKVGLMGLTAPFYPFYNPLGWDIEDPMLVLEREIVTLKENADIVILLSHLGIDQDEDIANHFPMIDVIIGGHTHHLFRDTEQCNETVLTAAGKYGHYVGEIMFTWDHKSKELKHTEAHTVNIDHLEEDQQSRNVIEDQYKLARKVLSQPVASLSAPLEVDWFKETSIIHQLAKTLQTWTSADIAMMNAGMLLDSLPAGVVTRYDIHRICPHPINPCVVQLTGEKLLEVIRESITKRYINTKVKGFGFRGKIIGKMIFVGVEISTVLDENGEVHLESVKYNGEELYLDRIYTIATPDMFTFGHLSTEISRAKSKKFYMPEFIRDLLALAVKQFVQE
ncbi:2',3'-cyclic-nucleotide 2'-phosphodiesterase (5'-nucleotidase family) [Natronobacillus azotifigens]|uniref:Bifunctional UDP-sugar hydrolase/5'-nucleotidase n=1 Tax=Natronobacillus azotifigens TaxID=472978 RepID=A0A9J6RCJ1_9BACI|nr:bifunctional UDP-sugar hydrolase/5'-nucleotidase [Natronobacillus azotifigens]MCZ0703263.1 bifunctional UDP-sugar hydrolase/5'-nucleotidase [Natronobacillus azotifigens]